jgi:hypothetical protein
LVAYRTDIEASAGVCVRRGVFVMPGDPKECRQHALRCTELAEQAQSPERAKLFRNLAKQWLKLAIELERAYAFRDEFEPKPKKR